MKFGRFVFLLVLTVFLFSSGSNSKVNASPTSCPSTNPLNCFNGFVVNYPSGGVTSAYTDIYTPNSYPANYSPSESTAWVMIANGSKYAQVGWDENNGDYGAYGSSTFAIPAGVHYFYEIYYGATNSDYQVFNTYGPATGTTHGYRIELSGSNWVGTVDGAQISSFSNTWSGNSSVTLTSGTAVQFEEELASGSGHAQNSAFAGTTSNHAKFSNMRTYDGTTHYSPTPSFESLDTSAAHSLSHYGNTTTYPDQSNSYMELWDTRY